jgi:nucleoside 2-deoxyribosyltransferase
MKTRRVYLSGAIEHASDGGRGWRKEIGRFLVEEFGAEVYDPAADEKKDLTEEERRHFRRWKSEAPGRFRETVRKIIAWDLGHIENRSDCVLAFWDDSAARGGGTAAEITLAHRLGKPVYLVLGMPLESASGWVIAAADLVFRDFESLKTFLRTGTRS